MEEEQEPLEREQGYTINKDYMKIPEVDDQTDYFAFISNDDFVTFYGQLLRLRMQVDNFSYPYEEFIEDDGISEHIARCNGALHMKLISILSNAKDENGKYLHSDVVKNKAHYKYEELAQLTAPLIEKYIEEVQVNYITLSDTNLIFIPDYEGEVEGEFNEDLE